MPDLAEAGLGVRRLVLACDRVDNDVQIVIDQHSPAPPATAPICRKLLCAKIETIEPGFGIERLRLVAARVEPLAPQPVDGELAGEPPAPDLALLIDRLAVRLGARRIHRLTALESDLPERSVGARRPARRDRELAAAGRARSACSRRPSRSSRSWRCFPTAPRCASNGAASAYRVAAADGPERVYGEWWRRDGGARGGPRLFPGRGRGRRPLLALPQGDGEDPATGDLSWHLHGLFA